MVIRDGLVRDTIAARLDTEKKVIVEGDAGMNTGVLQRGGVLVVNNTEEFAGSNMKGRALIVREKSRGYVGANMKGGTIFFKGNTRMKPSVVDGKDIIMLVRLLGISQIEAMMFKKYETF